MVSVYNLILQSIVYDQVEALCVIWASGQVNADLQAIEKALQASGSKVKTNQNFKTTGLKRLFHPLFK
jgi:hypothetical protein